MAKEKKKGSNFCLSEEAKKTLRELAAKENRSYTNMLETLIHREKQKQG
jgi:hypothetical protein